MEHSIGATEPEEDLWSCYPPVCLVCAQPILKSEVLEEGEEEEQTGDEVTSLVSILHCFFKSLHVRRGPKKEWQLESEKLPFCQGCKAQIKRILEVQRKVEELQAVIQNGIQEVREKIAGFESEFQSQGVYRRDRRYFLVRREILGDTCLDPDVEFKKKLNQLKQESRDPTKRRVGRPSKKDKAEWGEDLLKKQQKPRRTSTRRRPVGRPPKRKVEAVPSSSSCDKSVVVMRATEIAATEDFKSHSPADPAAEVWQDFAWDHPYESSGSNHEDKKDHLPKPSSQRKSKKPITIKRGKRRTTTEGKREEKVTLLPKPKLKRRGRPSTIKGAKWTIKPDDDDMAWEDGAADDPPLPPPKKRPSKRDADDDFVLEEDAADELVDDEEDEDYSDDDDKRRGYLRIDEKSGLCSYRNITLEKVVDSEQYKCRDCSELVPNTQKDLKVHVIRNHTRLTACRKCDRKFNSVCQLKKHIKHVHDGVARRKFEADCPICGRPRMRKSLIRKHMWTHYSEQDKSDAIASGEPLPKPVQKDFVCDVCGHQTKSRQGWLSHKESHNRTDSDGEPLKINPDELHLCPKCGKSVKHLQRHLDVVHPPEDLLRFECMQCNIKFLSLGLLNQHKRIHKMDFKCHLCPRVFSLEKTLQKHINVHLNIRPFQCEHCPSAFSYKHLLGRHNKIYHEAGSNPKRKSYVRGPEQKTLEQRKKKSTKTKPKLDQKEEKPPPPGPQPPPDNNMFQGGLYQDIDSVSEEQD